MWQKRYDQINEFERLLAENYTVILKFFLHISKEEQKERLPGQFVSLKQDKQQRTFLFTGQYQKVEKPATDFVTKQTIPGRTVTKWRFQVYDVTDPNNPSEAAIWERGNTEAEKILYWLARQTPQLTIMRNGAAGSQKTTYDIYPAK